MKTAIEALFQTMASDGWAVESSGDIESPTGAFDLLEITEKDVQRIGEDFADVLDTYGRPQSDEIVGWFVVVTDSQGFVFVTRYDSEREALSAYKHLEADYILWEDATPLP